MMLAVGLSLSITSQLTVAGKLILIVSMFVGRIGTLTTGIIFSRKIQSKNYLYPSARLMVS
jgi:Trk-type K+ transport system membrane component